MPEKNVTHRKGTMKVSFDGLRMNLASDFNSLARLLGEIPLAALEVDQFNSLAQSLAGIPQPEELRDALYALAGSVGFLMCVFNDHDAEDMNDLSDKQLVLSFEELDVILGIGD